jgi:hypothetical protein
MAMKPFPPKWIETARELGREATQNGHTAAQQPTAPRDGAAKSAVEAVMYELRTYGLAALAGPNCQRRVGDLSPDQVCEVVERLDRLRPKYRAITDDLLLLLAELVK